MKRFIQVVCILLVCAMLMPISALAAADDGSRASNFFTASSVYFWHVSGSNYQIWFSVTAVNTMQKVGVSKIVVERSTDEEDWETVKTYRMADYSQMICENTSSHSGYVPFTASSGYSYRANVTLYAKNSSGTGEMTETTAILDLR